MPQAVDGSESYLPGIDKSEDHVVEEIIPVDTNHLADDEPQPLRLTNLIFRRRRHDVDDAVATKRSVYDDPELAQYYWPKPEYEGLHRFDPEARWTYKEEKALVRKIDWRVMLWAAIAFSAANIDRSNLTLVLTDNFLNDLKMTNNDYNLGDSMFHLAFLFAELPSQLLSKKIGPDRLIPTQICAWSLVSMFQVFLSGRTSFLVCRALLGFLQGGFAPGLILYLSYYYTKNELPLRLVWFWILMDACSIAGSSITFGILRMSGIQGLAGWRWLFLIDGLITLVIGVATFFMMLPSPTQSKARFRPKGWFTDREEVVMISRILRDDPTKGDMHNREGLTLKRLGIAICDYDLWPLYVLGLMFGIPSGPPENYVTLSLRSLGFKTLTTNLLIIPYIVGRTINTLLNVWILPFLIGIYTLPKKPDQWVYFGLTSGLLSFPNTQALQVAWCSRNAGAVASRTVNTALYSMFFQASGIIFAQIYQADDAPRYRRGNRWLLGICLFNIVVLYPATKLYYIWRNRQHAEKWNAMSPEEKSHYLKTTENLGNRRLDFRFVH